MVINIERLRHYGSQMLAFESETLFDVPDQSQKHLVVCATEDINKRRFECDQWEKAFSKHSGLIRHKKKVHPHIPRETGSKNSSVVEKINDHDADESE